MESFEKRIESLKEDVLYMKARITGHVRLKVGLRELQAITLKGDTA